MRRRMALLLGAWALAAGTPMAGGQYVPAVLDVVGALQRFHSNGAHPEESSLEFHDLLRGVLSAPNRDPYGNLMELAGRVFTRTHAELRQPLLAPADRPVLRVALWTPSPEIDSATRYVAVFDASLDGSAWFPLVRASGDVFCQVDLQQRFGARSVAPGWHSLAVRATVAAWPGMKRADGACAPVETAGGAAPASRGTPFWSETRDLRPLVYGVQSPSGVQRMARPGRVDALNSAPPEAWVRAVLDATAATLDPALPVTPVSVWVRDTLARAGRVRPGAGPQWEVAYCGADMVDRFPDRSRAEICVRASNRDERLEVSLEFSSGPFQDDLGLRRAPDPPAFRTGFVATLSESMELKRLSDLETALTKPPDDWPAPDLRVSQDDITFRPPAPFPGDVVDVTFVVHNDGPSDERALIDYALAAPGMTADERGQFHADVPAGGVYQFTRSVRLPLVLGAGHAVIQAQIARPRGSMRPVRERRMENNAAAKIIGAWRRRF